MEAIYIIMALVLVVITNIFCTSVIADRYNIRNRYGKPYRNLLIGMTSLFAFFVCTMAMLIVTGQNSDGVYSNGVIGLGFDFLVASSVVLAWATGLIAYHSIKGFIRNFRKFLPGFSVSTNKFIDRVIGVKDILFNRAKTRVVAELHKDEEIKLLTVKLHELEGLLRLSQAKQPAALTLAPVEPAKQLPSPATSPRKRTKPTGGTGVTTNP